MFRPMRRMKQEIPKEECRAILTEEKRGVLAVIGDEGYPYAIPLNFYYEPGEETIYLHGAKEGHKIDAVRSCDKVCFTVWNRGCQKDGHWSYYVTSVVAMGRAELVTDEAVALEKCRKLALKYFPTKEQVEEDLARSFPRVQVIAVHIEHMTGKLVHEE